MNNNYLNAETVSVENDLEFNLYRLYVKLKQFDPPTQNLLYISKVPTLFAATNKHDRLFSIFCYSNYESDPRY